MIKKAALCKNSLKPGHIANKCCAPPMCKKCNKHHNTLVHIEADPKMEGTKKVSKDVTYVAPSKQSEEVFLMTYRVEVMVPGGSVMQTRALLDCAVSTSLVTERLVKKLHLPRRRNNFKINGLNVHPRGTVSFKVAGVGGGGKQVKVEPSVFPKVTDDLPTFPVSPVEVPV